MLKKKRRAAKRQGEFAVDRYAFKPSAKLNDMKYVPFRHGVRAQQIEFELYGLRLQGLTRDVVKAIKAALKAEGMEGEAVEMQIAIRLLPHQLPNVTGQAKLI